jgi:hypothetical protein
MEKSCTQVYVKTKWILSVRYSQNRLYFEVKCKKWLLFSGGEIVFNAL